jgi:hypothetical protein
MLTLFTVPKAFRGEFDQIQRNAIRSWAALRPACQIILTGDDEGTHELAREVGALHLPAVERNEFGTPLLHSIFAAAEARSMAPHLCYINADIVLMSDFLPAVHEAHAWNPRSLIVGRRRDMHLGKPLPLGEVDWEKQLRQRMQREARLHEITGLDFFVFPRGLWGELPPFAIGRGLWDEWLIYRARALGVPVIEATERITALHQNHSYSHHPEGEQGVWEGVEKQRNWSLGGGLRHAYTLRDATHRLTKIGIRRRVIPFDLRRCLILPMVTSKLARPLVKASKAMAPALRAALGGETPEI